MTRTPRKEFPFSLAILIAMVLHLAIGLALRHQAILAAALPVVPAQSQSPPPPVSVRFVEVPPDSPTVQEPPDTPYYSDANRRADPSPPKPPSPAPGMAAQTPQPIPSPPPVAAAVQGEPSGGEGLAGVNSGEGTPPGNLELRKPKGDSPGLGDSLKNLDRYLPADGNSWGNVPQEDSGSGVFFDTKGHDLGPWANRVIAMVRSNWIVPVAASLGMKGSVGVSFEVDRSGKVLNPQLVTTSGVVSFDQAALNAIRSSDPMPPLPDYFPLPRLSAVFRFYYNMNVPN